MKRISVHKCIGILLLVLTLLFTGAGMTSASETAAPYPVSVEGKGTVLTTPVVTKTNGQVVVVGFLLEDGSYLPAASLMEAVPETLVQMITNGAVPSVEATPTPTSKAVSGAVSTNDGASDLPAAKETEVNKSEEKEAPAGEENPTHKDALEAAPEEEPAEEQTENTNEPQGATDANAQTPADDGAHTEVNASADDATTEEEHIPESSDDAQEEDTNTPETPDVADTEAPEGDIPEGDAEVVTEDAPTEEGAEDTASQTLPEDGVADTEADVPSEEATVDETTETLPEEELMETADESDENVTGAQSLPGSRTLVGDADRKSSGNGASSSSQATPVDAPSPEGNASYAQNGQTISSQNASGNGQTGTTAPKTGDEQKPLFYGILVGLAVIAIIIIVIVMRRRNKKNQEDLEDTEEQI